jgi:hypothetical protein
MSKTEQGKKMNELIKREEALDAALAEKAKELSGGSGFKLLRFDANEKKYTLAGDEVVEIGRQFAVAVDQYEEGWTKFVDKRPAETIIKRLGDKGKVLPTREQLSDVDLADTEHDPWVFQRSIVLIDCKTGEVCKLIGKSVGMKIALGDLLQTASYSRGRGSPIIKLGIGYFKTKYDAGKKRARPDLDVIGFTGDHAKIEPAQEMKIVDADDEEVLPPWLDAPDDDADRDYLPDHR